MAKRKVKVPRKIAGVKIKKRHRKQLKALASHIERVEELVAAGSAVLAMLGLAHKLGGKGGNAGERSSAVAH